MARPGRWTLVHVASLAAILAFVTFCARGQWFFGDEWDFISFRGIRGTHQFGLWMPHNEHWSTVPILLWRGIFHFVGISTYWPYMGLLFAAHLLCVHFLWQILRRIPGVPPVLAIAGAAVLGFYGGGWENLLWAFQIGFVGSLAFGLGMVAAIRGDGSRGRVAAVAVAAVVSLMMSGISVVMVGVVGITAFAKWGWRKALLVTAPAGVVYLAWFQRYAKPSLAMQDELHGTPGDIPRFVVGGLGGTLGEAVDHRSWGTYLLIGLGVAVAWNARRWWRSAPEALAMGVGAVALYAVISQGRGALPQPATSRYLYLSAGLMLPLVVLTFATLSARWVWSRAIAVVATLALVVTGGVVLERQSHEQRRIDLTNKGQFIAAEQLAKTGIHLVSDQPQAPFAPDLKIADVNSLRRRGKSFTQAINDRDRAGAKLALQVGSTEEKLKDRPLGDTTAPLLDKFDVEPLSGGCVRIDPHDAGVEVRTGTRSAFSIRSARGGQVLVYLEHPSGFAGPRFVTLEPRVTTTIVSDVVGKMILQLPPGASVMCGVVWE